MQNSRLTPMIVKTHHITFDGELTLQSGAKLGPITLAYETYGRLNESRSNAFSFCMPCRATPMSPDVIRPTIRNPAGGMKPSDRARRSTRTSTSSSAST